jgi:hypothetical protein
MSAGSIGNRAFGVASALIVGFMEGETYHTKLHSFHPRKEESPAVNRDLEGMRAP